MSIKDASEHAIKIIEELKNAIEVYGEYFFT